MTMWSTATTGKSERTGKRLAFLMDPDHSEESQEQPEILAAFRITPQRPPDQTQKRSNRNGSVRDPRTGLSACREILKARMGVMYGRQERLL